MYTRDRMIVLVYYEMLAMFVLVAFVEGFEVLDRYPGSNARA